MGEEEQVDNELAFVKATKVLDGMSIEDREEYAYGVIESFSNAADAIMKIEGKLKQAKAIHSMSKELNENKGEKGVEVAVCFLYSVKIKYRPLFVNLLKIITGIEQKVEMPK